MLRTRRVGLMGLVIVVAAGWTYWMIQREPSPVLRTIVLSGAQPNLFNLDEDDGRFYFRTNDIHPLTILDARTGNQVHLQGGLGVASGLPIIDHQSGHYFDADATNNNFLMIDRRSDAVLKTIPFPGGLWVYNDDIVRDRLLLAFGEVPDVMVIDGHTGQVIRHLPGCLTSTPVVISRATNRLFELCSDDSLLVFDYQSYRQVAHRHDPQSILGSCAFCWATVDQATQRLFVPSNNGVSVLDARTGALVHTQPIKMWGAGTLAILPGSHDVLVVPYGDPALGPAARTVLVLDGRTGAVVHRWVVSDNPTQALVNPLTGHVLVASVGPVDSAGEPVGYGTLSVLDPRSGAVLRRVETGILPGSIAEDARTRRLFAVNFNTAMDGQLSALSRNYPDGWWSQFQRRLKALANWLPFNAPQPPPPPGTVSVTMFDLTKL